MHFQNLLTYHPASDKIEKQVLISNNYKYIVLLLLVFLLPLQSCTYSLKFKDASVDPNLKTFSITPFNNKARIVVPTLANELTESFRRKLLRESPLSSTTANADVEFKGSITRYDITAVAPKPGESTAFSRLDISLSVEYINNLDPSLNWKNQFSRFADFDSSLNLSDVQDALIDEIIEQLVEDLFNKAFSNW